MKDSEAERIVQIFKDAGMRIEIGETYSVRGQIAQLLNGVEQILNPKPEIPTYEQLYEVYKCARGLCYGVDWNNGTAAGHHRKALIKAVDEISRLPKSK